MKVAGFMFALMAAIAVMGCSASAEGQSTDPSDCIAKCEGKGDCSTNNCPDPNAAPDIPRGDAAATLVAAGDELPPRGSGR